MGERNEVMDEGKYLEVRMLGEFSMVYGGEVVEVSKVQTSRAMHLLQILLYAGESGISRQKLVEYLFEREPVGQSARDDAQSQEDAEEDDSAG